MPSSSDSGRKRKRMLSNRESARRSRARKQERLTELINEAASLKEENGRIRELIEDVSRRKGELETENLVRRTQLEELTERLRYASSVLRGVEEVCGMKMDIPEIPDPLLRPWKLPCPTQAILASPSMILS